jgi:glycine/D-amino acid oxidase-like deaminating enzyme
VSGLRRIWEPAAYGPAPIAECWWADTAETGDWPALEGDAQTDVAVIGAGFTGLNAALHLARAGIGVTVLEAQHPFWGASGRNGGFCCLGGAKAGFADMARSFGEDAARDYCRAERAAVDHVAELIARHDLDVDRHSDGETQLAHRPRDFAALRDSVDHIRDVYGVTPTLTPPEALAQAGMQGPFHGALTTPIGFALNPRKYAAGLASAAAEAGAAIHGHSAVTAIDPVPGGGYRLRTAQGSLTAGRVVVATNGYSSDNLPGWMAGRYLPTQSSVIVTRPMSAEELSAQGWTSPQMCYDSRNLLHYFRRMPDGRMLFGMRGGLRHTPGAEAAIRRMIRRDFDSMFPAWRHVETPHYWSGLVCLTRDLLPYAGPIPDMSGVFAGFAYHGNGVSMGSYTGALLADLVQGRRPGRPYPAPMRHLPRRFPFGRFRRALMRPAYLHYRLKDG